MYLLKHKSMDLVADLSFESSPLELS